MGMAIINSYQSKIIIYLDLDIDIIQRPTQLSSCHVAEWSFSLSLSNSDLTGTLAEQSHLNWPLANNQVINIEF